MQETADRSHCIGAGRKLGWGGGVGMTPWCVVLVCSWRRLLADHHSLPFPWAVYGRVLHSGRTNGRWWVTRGGCRVMGGSWRVTDSGWRVAMSMPFCRFDGWISPLFSPPDGPVLLVPSSGGGGQGLSSPAWAPKSASLLCLWGPERATGKGVPQHTHTHTHARAHLKMIPMTR